MKYHADQDRPAQVIHFKDGEYKSRKQKTESLTSENEHTCATSLSGTALWALLLRQPCWICWLSSSMAAGLSVMTLTDSWKLTLFRARSLGVVSLTSSAARHDFCVNKTNNKHEHQRY